MDFSEFNCGLYQLHQGEEEEQPGNQGADSNRLVPHGCGEEFGSVQVDDEEGDGSPKLAQERQAQLRKEE